VVASQDAKAFGELIRRHQSQVRNFLRKLARDETLADDLAQDCFLHVWDKIHTYSGSGSFIGWVLKVASEVEALPRDSRTGGSRNGQGSRCHSECPRDRTGSRHAAGGIE
jgi:hypothetical protein